MCSKKVFTKVGAVSALNFNKHTGRQYRKEKRMYYCENCNGWHLTSQELMPETKDYKPKFKKGWKKIIKKQV